MENFKLKYGCDFRQPCKKWIFVILVSFIGLIQTPEILAKSSGKQFTEVSQQPKKIQIKGKVFDSHTHESLVGVNVYLKGSGIGNITNVNGEFFFTIPNPSKSLTVSFIGYETQTILIEGKTEFEIYLKSTIENLEEVVVTGYQTISRERASGSFGATDKAILESLPVQTPTSLLLGQIAGVDMNNDKINIRGISSFKNKDVLVVVDGFPIENKDNEGLNSINPNNIESINVLKDAAASSIWGARAANGVIVITTKSAKSSDKDGMKVDINSFMKVGSKIDLDYANPIVDSKTQLDIEKYLMNEFYTANPNGIYDPTLMTYENASARLTEGEYLESMRAIGYLPGNLIDGRIAELSQINYQDDVKKYLLRTPIYQQHNLSISGKSKKHTYNFSLFYDDNTTSFKENSINNFTIDFKDTFHYNDRITINAGFYANYKEIDESGATLGEIKGLSAYDRLINEDGSYANNTNGMNIGMRNHLNNYDFPYDWNYNLLEEVRNRELTSNILRNRFQFGINVKIIKGLSYNSKIQFERKKQETRNYYGERTYFVREKINSAARFENGLVSDVYYPKGDIIANERYNKKEGFTFRNQIDFKRFYKQKHYVNFIAGTEIIESNTNNTILPTVFGASRYMNGVSILPDTKGTLDYGLLGQTSIYGKKVPGYIYGKVRYFSAYSNLSYTYDEKYTLTGSVRTDASNIVSDDSKYRYTPLWSIGGNWNLTNEDFIKNINFIDRLNFRISYGINANAATFSSNVTTVEYYAGGAENDYHISSGFNHGNPDLKWEITRSLNYGIDYSLSNSRLFGSIDIYNKKGEDLYYRRTYPSTSGVSQLEVNYAEISNKGFEATMGTKLIVADKFRLTSKANYSYNKNEIIELAEDNLLISNQKGSGAYIKGGSVGDLYAYKYAGYEDGTPYIVANDGTKHAMNTSTPYVTNDTFELLYNQGSTIAPHRFGWTNTINYNNFTITAIITGKFGHVFANYNLPYHRPTVTGNHNFNENLPDYLDNESAKDFPGLINSSTISNLQKRREYTANLTSNIDDASFIRFNDLIINYNVSNYLKGLKFLSGANIYCNVNNLGMIWTANKWNTNPENPRGTLKAQTTYTFGVKLNLK